MDGTNHGTANRSNYPNLFPRLKRLLRIRRAYDWADKGDELLAMGKVEDSLCCLQEGSGVWLLKSRRFDTGWESR